LGSKRSFFSGTSLPYGTQATLGTGEQEVILPDVMQLYL